MSANDLLWFLLPVAAAAGWFAAKRSLSGNNEAFWDYSQRFHKELKQLLLAREGSVKVLDSFSDSDSDAVETHIALGNLYRRRGEFDRAIVIHESITARQNLEPSLCSQAQYELAKDYEAAGLLDRSEDAFRVLIASQQLKGDACEGLLQLYERQQDWKSAIAVALQCETATGQSLAHALSHYYCELSLVHRKSQQIDVAQQHLQSAFEHWPQSPRVHILMAELALDAGDYRRAIALYEQVEALRPELMPEIINKRFAALQKAGDIPLLEEFIRRIQSQRNAYSVIRTTRHVIAELHNVQLADRFFKDQILKRPSMKGLRDWAHDQLALSSPGERDKVQVICDLLDRVMEDKPAYRCQSCGFQGNLMHWRCPGCQSWDTVLTIIGVEGE